VQLDGKRRRRGQLNAVAPGQLFHVVDSLSKRRFLVDTGAAYSIFPHTSPEQPSGLALQGPGGQAIPCWGEKELQIQIGDRLFMWTFLLAKVDFAIIGADFLKHFRLAVDLAARQLIDTHSMSSLTGGAAQETGGGLLAAVAAAAPQYRSLFSKYPAVADTSGKLPPAKHDVEHHLLTQGPPVMSRFRRLDAAKLQAAKAEFAKMKAEGVIRWSDSTWSSPLHMV
jgi:hypothetical protein